MTLRTRLIATLFALTAVAMVALAAVTYTSQRSALLDQVDAQLRSSIGGVARQLEIVNEGGAVGLLRTPGVVPRPLGDRGGPDGPGRRGRPAPNLPPGTYGELRGADGRRVGTPLTPTREYGGESSAVPGLPETLEPGPPFTADAEGDGDLRYRVLVTAPAGAGGSLVAAVPLTDVDDTLQSLVRTEALVIAAALLLLTGLAWALVRIGLRPLDRMADTAGAIAAGDLDRRIDDADPRTEVGRLGSALNGMLGRLERAFAEREASEGRLRQFLSDASHELRTPLASIRGYAELFRVGAVAEPQDLDRAMGRIEDEAARMGRLVEDLLTLARLDEAPDAPKTEVDVATLVDDAVRDARATDPSRPITAETDGAALVWGDEASLRQVLANLTRNALIHTPPGTPVRVTAAHDGDHVRLVVRDAGEGLPTEDPEVLFGRFWRAEGGRRRGRDGAGLGLAIVAAVVAAHHGAVMARNLADDGDASGAEFVVRLPLAPSS
ncbi:MAG: HAMP domain-containing protein [Patulibacter sp.]|nr:HAMP domain-containing protein [Patulibacter sp.]